MALSRAVLLFAAALVAGPAVCAEGAPVPALRENPPAKFKPDDSQLQPPAPVEGSDTWIFSGNLQGSNESFSGTLVAQKDQSAQFELKLGGGATCDGGQLKGDLGLVRLPEITCSDDRPMRALFVPQAGHALKVFGHVGEQRFYAEAHLLGTEAPPAPKQTAQPKGPLGLPPKPPADKPPADKAPGPPAKP